MALYMHVTRHPFSGHSCVEYAGSIRQFSCSFPRNTPQKFSCNCENIFKLLRNHNFFLNFLNKFYIGVTRLFHDNLPLAQSIDKVLNLHLLSSVAEFPLTSVRPDFHYKVFVYKMLEVHRHFIKENQNSTLDSHCITLCQLEMCLERPFLK